MWLDICFAVNPWSYCLDEPSKAHWVAAKHMLRYLRGIIEHGLWHRKVDELNLEGSTDVD